ncbi:unnamed protein product [Durusdinium trenchii]|uniref:Uncharacterized protein n=1 Tax=Durusdinium trenchii TaxID=1381693 RepID=A0ABP0IV05_9DINO
MISVGSSLNTLVPSEQMATVGMELAVPAPAAAASIGHGILSLTGAPQDPFERLDATMEPTPEWVHLRGVLEENPASVRNIISLALLKEVARSFQNVAGQLQAMREIKEQFERLLESEEAASLEHLMRDIPPSDIHALEREACGINEDSRTLRSALETGDISGLHSRAKRMANKARRFREKHARLRPSLDKLQRGLMDIASKCAEKAQRSDELIAEVEQRKDFWWNLLVVANCLALLGGAGFIICLLPTTCLSLVHLLAKSWAIGKAKVLLSTAKAFATKTAAAATTKAAAAQTAQATAATTKAALATATAKAETAKHLASSLGTAAAAEGAAGTAAAVGAGVAAGGAASVASIGAPAATFLGSQMLGSLGVSLGLMSTPAAPIGVVLGSGAAAAAAVKLIWESVTSVDTAAALNAAQAATSAVAQQQAAEQAANAAAAAAMEAGQAASEASQAASQAAAALNDAADSVSALEAAISSLSATVTADATFLFGGFLLMALVLLGYAGRDLVKTLLGRLWAAEIEEHRRHKATFQHMEQVIRKAADQLLMVYKKNKALESCLDIVVEVAEDLAAKAEDALEARSEEKEAEMATLHEQVEQLCTLYENVPRAMEVFHHSVRELGPAAEHIQSFAYGSGAHEPPQEGRLLELTFSATDQNPVQEYAVNAVDQDSQAEGQVQVFFSDSEVDEDEGWILIKSSSLPLPLRSPSASDCLPSSTYILVPVMQAAQLGALFAAGPSRDEIIKVSAQGSATGSRSRSSAWTSSRVERCMCSRRLQIQMASCLGVAWQCWVMWKRPKEVVLLHLSRKGHPAAHGFARGKLAAPTFAASSNEANVSMARTAASATSPTLRSPSANQELATVEAAKVPESGRLDVWPVHVSFSYESYS